MRDEYFKAEDFNRTAVIEATDGELDPTLCIFIPLSFPPL